MALECNIGDIKITADLQTIKVEDGEVVLTGAASLSGRVSYTRTALGGKLYIDGELVAEQLGATSSPTNTQSSIAGYGSIKGLKIRSALLTHEQITTIG